MHGAVVDVAVQERRRLLRDGIGLMLAGEPGIRVAGLAADDVALRQLAADHELDVVVVEVSAPEWDVARLVADVRHARPAVRVVGLHPGRRTDHLAAGKVAGVDTLVSVGAGAAGLIAAIEGVEAVPPPIRMVDRRRLPGRQVLTRREREVLRHISAGLTTKQSAQLLRLSPKTVDNHKQHLFAKLGVQNQAHAVAIAHRAGILHAGRDAAYGA
jgi:DNA-binding NarL/FixJ family response regulator